MRVMQLIDSLDAGGAERVAVNIANALSKDGDSYLVVTRKEGLLRTSVDEKVNYFFLNKRSSFDVLAILRLRAYVRKHKIACIHAHSTSFFLAAVVSCLVPGLKLVWHDHYGKSEQLRSRKSWVLKYLSTRFSVVLAVNEKLKEWAQVNLRVPEKNIYFLPNFVQHLDITLKHEVPEMKGVKIICVANLRPQKNHLVLLESFQQLSMEYPESHLLLPGQDFEDDYSAELKDFVEGHELKNVHFLGARDDIGGLIALSDIGVLPSKSEGMPLAILEYALANLPVVATAVGQVPGLINKDTGWLVEPNNPEALTGALRTCASQSAEVKEKGEKLHRFVQDRYSEEGVMSKLKEIYQIIESE